MSVKTYTVKEVFRTVQGEGHHAGTAALFVRFAGCNMWSGDDEDRIRDAVRNEAECPRWCDTDFRAHDAMRWTSEELGSVVKDRVRGVPLIVLSGGEPLLQVDAALLDCLHNAAPHATISIETNGTVSPRFDYGGDYLAPDGNVDIALASSLRPWLWLTMSPKRARASTRLTYAHEIKLVVPAYNPDEWADFPVLHRFVQPLAHGTQRDERSEHRAAMWVAHGDGKWRLSLQTHKMVGVP
jgi:7-carboxy-7-deazaguanine synthase